MKIISSSGAWARGGPDGTETSNTHYNLHRSEQLGRLVMSSFRVGCISVERAPVVGTNAVFQTDNGNQRLQRMAFISSHSFIITTIRALTIANVAMNRSWSQRYLIISCKSDIMSLVMLSPVVNTEYLDAEIGELRLEEA